MLKIIEGETELILRDFPAVHLITGLAMIVVAVLLTSSFYDFALSSISRNDYNFAVLLTALVSAFLFFTGIYNLAFASIITTTINSRTKSLTIEKRSLLKKEFDEYKFEEVEKHLSVKIESQKGTNYYTPQIQLKYGEPIDLINFGLMRRGKTYDIVDIANKYLADEADIDNFKLTIFNDD
jgi:hypothetical protein